MTPESQDSSDSLEAQLAELRLYLLGAEFEEVNRDAKAQGGPVPSSIADPSPRLETIRGLMQGKIVAVPLYTHEGFTRCTEICEEQAALVKSGRKTQAEVEEEIRSDMDLKLIQDRLISLFRLNLRALAPS